MTLEVGGGYLTLKCHHPTPSGGGCGKDPNRTKREENMITNIDQNGYIKTDKIALKSEFRKSCVQNSSDSPALPLPAKTPS